MRGPHFAFPICGDGVRVSTMNLDQGEARKVKVAIRALNRLPASAPAADLFDAIRPCVQMQAGMFTIIRPGMSDALVSQTVGLPPRSFEGWLRMPPDLLDLTLTPII